MRLFFVIKASLWSCKNFLIKNWKTEKNLMQEAQIFWSGENESCVRQAWKIHFIDRQKIRTAKWKIAYLRSWFLFQMRREPPPADNGQSDCFDTLTRANPLHHHKIYSQSACFEECKVSYVINICGCRNVYHIGKSRQLNH